MFLHMARGLQAGNGGQKVQSGVRPALVGPGDEFVEAEVNRIAGRGEGDGVAAVAGRKDQRTAIESVGDTFAARLEATLAAEQVDRQQPPVAEARTAGLIERQGVKDSARARLSKPSTRM